MRNEPEVERKILEKKMKKRKQAAFFALPFPFPKIIISKINYKTRKLLSAPVLGGRRDKCYARMPILYDIVT